MKTFFKRLLLIIIGILILVITFVAITFPGVMTGMDAKVMCSCVFVTHRTPESVMEKELKVFPGLTWANFNVNEKDSTVTARLLWKESKAIYRKGLGCTLLAEQSESQVRSQKITPPSSPLLLTDTLEWPQGNKLTELKIPGVNYNALNSAVDEAFKDRDPKTPINTHAIVVVYDGQIVAEKYADGLDHNSRLMGWSMTKSIGSALIGIFLQEQNLGIDHSGLLAEWKHDGRKNITINNLLQATSGLKWSESYFNPSSTFHEMFIRRDNKAEFAASLALENKPGTVFQYSSGTSNILSRILREGVGDSAYYDYPYKKLFHRIGMNTAILEPDASGTFVMSSYGYASARDWARLGLLYLNDGVWNGHQILPKGWVEYSITPSDASPKQEYGAQIWLNRGNKENPSDCFLPGIPHDAFLFEGFERNSVTVIPSRKLVIVRLGVTHNQSFNLPEFLSDVMEAVPGSGAVAIK